MIEKELKPLIDKEEYSKKLSEAIEYVLYVTIYKPLFEILGIKIRRENARVTSLVDKLKSGHIQYQDGLFMGAFSAAASKELRAMGAKWDLKRKAFKLPEDKLTIDLRQAIAVSKHALEEQKAALIKALDKPIEIPNIDFNKYASVTIENLEAQVKEITPESITMPPEISPTMAEAIKTDYSDNLNLTIKDFSDEAIMDLRERVSKNMVQGFRADKIQGVLEAQYGVSRRKARFISRQETSLLVSKYRETRYTDAGITRYRWETSHDERVRQDHKDLNGKIFSWDNPPITNKMTGQRNNPGEDFGCRCLAIPILRIGGNQ